MLNKRFQFVWWFPSWKGFAFRRIDNKKTDLAYVYKWCIWIGWLEIRRWQDKDFNILKREFDKHVSD